MNAEDLERALRILSTWKQAARLKGDKVAQDNVALIERVIRGLSGR